MRYIKSGRTEEDYLLSEVSGHSGKIFESFTVIFLFAYFFVLCPSAFSQRKSDIGVFAGTSSYLGDLNPGTYFYAPSLAIGPIYRYNFHPMTSIRASGIYHSLTANDLDFEDPFQQTRGASFTYSALEFSAMLELNFQPYKTADRKKKSAIYTAAGFGYSIPISSSSGGGSQFSIPFSVGYKFNLGKRLSAGVEFSPRKLFSDKIDGVVNNWDQDKISLFGNKDWYTFAGAFFTYKIFNYREDCPAYD